MSLIRNQTYCLALVFVLVFIYFCFITFRNQGDTDSTAQGTSEIPATEPDDADFIGMEGYDGNQRDAYVSLNTARTQCGLAWLKRNRYFDLAAKNHAQWEASNIMYQHAEVPGTVGYTGERPSERVRSAGYPHQIRVGEGITSSMIRLKKVDNRFGDFAMHSLMSAPYHMVTAFSDASLIGVASSEGDTLMPYLEYRRNYFVMDVGFGSASKSLSLQPGTVMTYPCEGINDAQYELRGENPSPVPDRDLGKNPIGQPVLIRVAPDHTIFLKRAQFIGPNGPLELLPFLTKDTDPQRKISSDIAFVIPSEPLRPSTRYYVSIDGTDNGIPFEKNFSFSTAKKW